MSDDWRYSDEGDLDPDLTEEAGYAWWDPPERRWLFVLARVGMVIALLALVGGTVLVML